VTHEEALVEMGRKLRRAGAVEPLMLLIEEADGQVRFPTPWERSIVEIAFRIGNPGDDLLQPPTPAPTDPGGVADYFDRLNRKWFGISVRDDLGFTDEEGMQ